MSTHPRLPALAAGMVLAAVLTACGGGGSSSGSPGQPPPPPPPPPRVAETIVYNDPQGLRMIRDDGSGARTIDASNVEDFLISPNGEYVAYSVQGGSRALWVAPLQVGAPLHVSRNVDDPDGITWFDWSPDSTQLVYAAALDTRTAAEALVGEIYVVGRDGANERRINGSVGNPPAVELDFPDWSPDGAWILQQVFDLPTGSGSRTRRGLNLHDTRVAGPNSVRLATHPFDSSTPFQTQWSPNGALLAYNRAQGQDRDLLVLDPASGGPPVTLVAGNQQQPGPTWRWSPDGTRLAYLEQRTGGQPGLRLREALPGSSTQSTVIVSLVNQGEQIVNFLWSPDGTDLAFVKQTNEGRGLWIADRTGQRPHRRIGGALYDGPPGFAWSPDSARIAYVGRADPQRGRDDLYVAAVDGSSVVRIEQGLANFEAVNFAWSRDGQRLAFTVGALRESNLDPEQAIALFSARPDGTGVRELARYSSPGSYEFAYR
jgi:Tol biopolymer transport system component